MTHLVVRRLVVAQVDDVGLTERYLRRRPAVEVDVELQAGMRAAIHEETLNFRRVGMMVTGTEAAASIARICPDREVVTVEAWHLGRLVTASGLSMTWPLCTFGDAPHLLSLTGGNGARQVGERDARPLR